jgi:hypothetical protein
MEGADTAPTMSLAREHIAAKLPHDPDPCIILCIVPLCLRWSCALCQCVMELYVVSMQVSSLQALLASFTTATSPSSQPSDMATVRADCSTRQQGNVEAAQQLRAENDRLRHQLRLAWQQVRVTGGV